MAVVVTAEAAKGEVKAAAGRVVETVARRRR